MKPIASISLYSGRDIFTLPKTRFVWRMKRLPLGVKTKMLKTEKKFMNTKIELVVLGPDDKKIISKVNECLKTSTIKAIVAGLVAGFASKGVKAIDTSIVTFTVSLQECVEKVYSDVKIHTEIRNSSHWDKKWR